MGIILGEIANVIGANIPETQKDFSIEHLCTDSRQISFPEETLFIALTTPRRNGHRFIAAAYERGIRHFIVSEDPIEAEFPAAIFVKVPDTLAALQTLAAFHRQKYSLPVIGITGSNGKTIIKEWLYQLLSPDKNICRSPRSYNSQIGVPISVWQLNSHHQMAIFEAGISTTGEMQKLQEIIQPTVGIFTNLGAAHAEGFSCDTEKLDEKWKLFDTAATIICNTDDERVYLKTLQSSQQIITWGGRVDAMYKVEEVMLKESSTEVTLMQGDELQKFTLPFSDEASIENGLHCVVTCLHFGIDAGILQTRLSALHALQMRLEWKKGVHNSLLLNDSYSHDINSLEIALSHLKQQAGNTRLMAILSDLPGPADENTYKIIGDLLCRNNVLQIVGVGLAISKAANTFSSNGIDAQFFTDTKQLLLQFDRQQVTGCTVLIKGARSFGFERIAAALQQQQHETLLEINLSALTHNLNAFREILHPETQLMVMLKAFGYGSTDAELGRWLQHHGVTYLTVAYTDEGVALRNGGVQTAIMVMNPEPASFEALITHNLEPELYSIDILKSFLQFATDNALTQYPVHLKLDTGMHRLGFVPAQLPEILDIFSTSNELRIATVFTHLVASENPIHDAFTKTQGKNFEQFCKALSATLSYSFLKHAANTAAIVRHPDLHYDMVRLGIGLFGVSDAARNVLSLQPATRLYTTVAQVKKVGADQSVGYGRQAMLTRNSMIATVRIGYADGYSRQLGNGTGKMFVRNSLAPVVGNVCMDMTMIDVTDVPGVKEGDRVEVFGEHITVSALAQLCGTIPYEIMTGISQRVKRVMVEE
jgi:Alr-MurF fusion protein